MLIAIAGRAGSGKDALARALMEALSAWASAEPRYPPGFEPPGFPPPCPPCPASPSAWRVRRFSCPVKQRLEREDPASFNAQRWEASDAFSRYRTEPVAAYGGWSRRARLVDTAMKCRAVQPDVWVRALLDGYRPRVDNWIVPDMRFENEFLAVRALGGLCVHVDSAGQEAVKNCVSETSLDAFRVARMFDVCVDNAGHRADLRQAAHDIASRLDVCNRRSAPIS